MPVRFGYGGEHGTAHDPQMFEVGEGHREAGMSQLIKISEARRGWRGEGDRSYPIPHTNEK